MTSNRPKIEIDETCYAHLIHIRGLTPNDLLLERGEALELYDELSKALGLHVHEPDGCRGDCPCKQQLESQGG
jgi:hypothetical protein